ncbi:class I SAM-dependent methyltransferase [Rhizobium sp. VS19-DR104.2]|uniref:class I SAM-dependent methyltransferase n=1 Tax=unclassified Rhizobium TaxID=2613769 RepID=UPI001CC43899|nr:MULTISPECIES: class I SAM-dependent methyltransferase [unclassified Rhizobium]MBZ5762323.1 class I SAM-dependent methyltransferase [Rhizobium sp. VS19-DR96]MBZ5768974.1 class I SAM-dependent methyltransferase [Rhizobium sp. VS19-DR129.2]MBZ5775903.1 class I SAM-dependent methyltransferase [Rhizobium sp. VS19-DRK62.2]MBZ5786333.1 class I SAM-dependent methyltransferase [Rhizobium sp. VS19-DR121]MBZ5804327.1 class I SAM-dependent methyltransferase [Rhizobium sp. VS19-DR181]
MKIDETTSRPVSLYERLEESTTQPFGLQMLEKLPPIHGRSLIDIAAGTGGMAVVAAERGAQVLATDMDPAMVRRTGERLRPFSLCHVDIMDFQALDVSNESFEVSLSNFGVLAYSTWRRGLAEMIRVTRSNGWIALTMWTHGEDCSPAHLMQRTFGSQFPDRELWPSDLFPFFSEKGLEASVRDAGCFDVKAHVATADWSPYSSADVVSECDSMLRSFPGYATLDAHETLTLQKSLHKSFQSYAGRDGIIRLPTKAFILVARKM